MSRDENPDVAYYSVQQHQHVNVSGDMVWGSPERRAVYLGTPDQAFQDLWRRRAGANRVRIPGGMEFDAKLSDLAIREFPVLGSARVRVTYESVREE